MSYSRLDLADGQVLKAEHLKHIEKGIEAANNVGARNLLLNSDFADVLNSKGESSYNSLAGGDLPCIDKWLVYGAVVEVRSDEIYIYGSTNQAFGMYQNVPISDIDTGKTYTFAAQKTGGEIVSVQVNFSQGSVFSSGELCVYIDAGYYFTIGNGSWKWAALYEGEYTAETMPPYISKGRVTELANINGGTITMELLWENASPTSGFSAQNVTLDLNGYAGIIIEYTHHTSRKNDLRSAFCEVGKTLVIQSIYSDFYNGSDVGGSAQYAYRRAVVSTSGVNFTSGFYATGTGKVAEDVKIDVPYKIYGIKGVQK